MITEKDMRLRANLRLRIIPSTFEPSPKSLFTKELSLPRKMKFEGKWRLSANKDLKLALVETDNQVKNDELELRGNVISAESDAIVFQLRTIKEPDVDRIAM